MRVEQPCRKEDYKTIDPHSLFHHTMFYAVCLPKTVITISQMSWLLYPHRTMAVIICQGGIDFIDCLERIGGLVYGAFGNFLW